MIDKLSKINAKNISSKTTPDYQTSAEKQDYALQHKKLINKALKQDIKEKKVCKKYFLFDNRLACGCIYCLGTARLWFISQLYTI